MFMFNIPEGSSVEDSYLMEEQVRRKWLKSQLFLPDDERAIRFLE